MENSVVNSVNFVKTRLPLVIKTLKETEESVVIFVNSRTKVIHLAQKMEKKCNKVDCAMDILSLNGALNTTNFGVFFSFTTWIALLESFNSTVLF